MTLAQTATVILATILAVAVYLGARSFFDEIERRIRKL